MDPATFTLSVRIESNAAPFLEDAHWCDLTIMKKWFATDWSTSTTILLLKAIELDTDTPLFPDGSFWSFDQTFIENQPSTYDPYSNLMHSLDTDCLDRSEPHCTLILSGQAYDETKFDPTLRTMVIAPIYTTEDEQFEGIDFWVTSINFQSTIIKLSTHLTPSSDATDLKRFKWAYTIDINTTTSNSKDTYIDPTLPQTISIRYRKRYWNEETSGIIMQLWSYNSTTPQPLSLIKPIQDAHIIYKPDTGYFYGSNCADTDDLFCFVTFKRPTTDIKIFYFMTTYKSLAAIFEPKYNLKQGGASVFVKKNTTVHAYLAAMSLCSNLFVPFPDGIYEKCNIFTLDMSGHDDLEITMHIEKNVGHDGWMPAYMFELNNLSASDGRNFLAITRPHFYKAYQYFMNDILPTYSPTCSDLAAPTCTITYTIFSEFIKPNFSLIRHVSPTSDSITHLRLDGCNNTIGTVQIFSNLISTSPYRNDTWIELRTAPDLNLTEFWIRSESLLHRTDPTVPITCYVTVFKNIRVDTDASQLTRYFPWSMLDQVDRAGEWVLDRQGISIPEMKYSPIHTTAQPDCFHWQDEGAPVCTIQLNSFGTPEHPFYTITRAIIYSTDPSYAINGLEIPNLVTFGQFYHPLFSIDTTIYLTTIPLSEIPYNIRNDETIFAKFIVGTISSTVRILEDGAMQKTITLALNEHYHENPSVSYVEITPDLFSDAKHALTPDKTLSPTSFPNFNLTMFQNGESFVYTDPRLPIPFILASELIHIWVNTTSIAPTAEASFLDGTTTARIEFTFYDSAITSIVLGTDWGIRISTSQPGVNGTIQSMSKLPCYQKIKAGTDSFILYDDYVRMFESGPESAVQYNIMGWITSDASYRTTTLSIRSIDGLQIAGETCYIYLQPSASYSSNNTDIQHDIHLSNTLDVFFYTQSYPSYRPPPIPNSSFNLEYTMIIMVTSTILAMLI